MTAPIDGDRDGFEIDPESRVSVSFDSLSINTSYTVKCPECKRVENFDNQHTGAAWLVGHIHKEHGDVLPPYYNDRGGGGE